jgi:diacylglycerol kinase (ATP)
MLGLLCNPTSGGGRGGKIKEQVISHLQSQELDFLDLSGVNADAAKMNLKALDLERISNLIVIGGDGLVHLAIQKLARSAVPLLIIPAGTGNDFARSLGLNINKPLENLSLLSEMKSTGVDLGLVAGEYFAQILSTGFDSLVNERANQMRFIRGRMKYNVAIAQVLSTFKPRSYSFRVDEVHLESKAMLIAVSNGKSYGGGMMISPMSDLQDGYLDVMILGPVSRFEFLRVFPKVYSGSHINHPAVKFLKAKNVAISANAVAYADGERVGDLPIEVSIVEKCLRVLIP